MVKPFHYRENLAVAAYAVIAFIGTVNPVVYTLMFPLMAVTESAKMAAEFWRTVRVKRVGTRVEPMT